VAAREHTFDLSRAVVLAEVRKFAAASGWRSAPSQGGPALSFVQHKAFSLAALQQEITVFVDGECEDRTVVVVETQARTRFGSRQLYDWGQGVRLATKLLDAIADRQGPAASAAS
jgi:hypothetical protein